MAYQMDMDTPLANPSESRQSFDAAYASYSGCGCRRERALPPRLGRGHIHGAPMISLVLRMVNAGLFEIAVHKLFVHQTAANLTYSRMKSARIAVKKR